MEIGIYSNDTSKWKIFINGNITSESMLKNLWKNENFGKNN